MSHNRPWGKIVLVIGCLAVITLLLLGAQCMGQEGQTAPRWLDENDPLHHSDLADLAAEVGEAEARRIFAENRAGGAILVGKYPDGTPNYGADTPWQAVLDLPKQPPPPQKPVPIRETKAQEIASLKRLLADIAVRIAELEAKP